MELDPVAKAWRETPKNLRFAANPTTIAAVIVNACDTVSRCAI